MPKSAREKLRASKPVKRVRLDKAFAGVAAGQMLFVASPRVVADYISAIPMGETRTIPEMRAELALSEGCDTTCPVSTAIFVRVAAQAALEDLEDGADPANVLPFWRLIASGDKVATRLPVDGQWIDDQRAAEQVA